MGDLLNVATDAVYSLAECRERVKAWIQWADEQGL